ncbi:unnamed protein product [Chrysoparadoxa australica]
MKEASDAAEHKAEMLRRQIASLETQLKEANGDELVEELESLRGVQAQNTELLQELAEKSAISKHAAELQKALEQAQAGLKATNDKFDAEVVRLNDELAEAEKVAEDRTSEV